MLDSLVRVSRRVGWVTDLLHAARERCIAPLLHDRRRAARTPEVSPFVGANARRRGTSPPGPLTSPATGRGDLHHEGKYARRRRLERGHAQEFLGRESANPTAQPALADELNPLGSTFEVPPVWLLTVSRTLELSLQSSFQLSLTVLVRYRSRGHI